jgi:uncharacterized membrane protein YtjA (UPF0391 family)
VIVITQTSRMHRPPLQEQSAAFSVPASPDTQGRMVMSILKWALIFLAVSIVAGILGFTGVSAASADVARVLFYLFAVIFIVLLLLGLTIFRA